MLFQTGMRTALRSRFSNLTLLSSKATATSYRSLNIVSRPSDLIGNTPLIDLNNILENHGGKHQNCQFCLKNLLCIFILFLTVSFATKSI